MHTGDAFMSTATVGHGGIHRWRWRSHAGNRSPAGPRLRTITIRAAGARGLRTYVQLFACSSRGGNDVLRRGIEFDVRVRLRVSPRTSTPATPRQPGGPDGPEHPTPTSPRERTGPRRRSPPTNFQLAFGARVGQRLAGARANSGRKHQGP